METNLFWFEAGAQIAKRPLQGELKLPKYGHISDDEIKKLEEIKQEVCHALRRKAERRGWTQKELAIFMGTNETYASRIIHKRVKKISLTKLFVFLARIDGGFRFLIANR